MPVLSESAAQAREGPRNPAELRNSSVGPQRRARTPVIVAEAVAFKLQTALALHEVLLLDARPDGTVTVVDETLICPHR